MFPHVPAGTENVFLSVMDADSRHTDNTKRHKSDENQTREIIANPSTSHGLSIWFTSRNKDIFLFVLFVCVCFISVSFAPQSFSGYSRTNTSARRQHAFLSSLSLSHTHTHTHNTHTHTQPLTKEPTIWILIVKYPTNRKSINYPDFSVEGFWSTQKCQYFDKIIKTIMTWRTITPKSVFANSNTIIAMLAGIIVCRPQRGKIFPKSGCPRYDSKLK